MVRAVSFDFHDTVAICPQWFLLETRHLVSATYAYLVEAGYLAPRLAVPEELDAAYRRLRLAIHEHGNELDALGCLGSILSEFAIEIPPALACQAIESLQRAAFRECRPRPGSVEAILTLANAGLPVGITSNAVYHPFLEWSLERFGLQPHLRSVISSASCGFYKSRPEIYHHTADALGVPITELVHIGDSFRFDVVAAKRLGARAIWLNLTGQPPPEEDIADVIVTDLDDLAAKVLRLP